MTLIWAYLLLGLVAGVASGIVGIGGGVIIIPALVYLFGFSQHLAQGTTVALLVPPIGILAAYIYYKNGFIDFKASSFICLSFVLGGFIGSKIAVNISTDILQKIFGVIIVIIGLSMIFKK